MAQLLARTADRLYWGARYIERAEDTARIVRAYNEFVVDDSSQDLLRWEPLAAVAGSDPSIVVPPNDPSGEITVVRYLLADRSNPGSIVSTVTLARENLRTTREVMPREAWQAVNQLTHYVEATASGGVERQLRDRFLGRVIEISRRLKRRSAPLCLRERVATSGRRWDQRGPWRTVALMWRLRLLYWLGVGPERLARLYR